MNTKVIPSLQRIGLVGFGQMGQGIAQAAVMHGYTVQLFDTNNSALRKGYEGTQSRISKAFSRMNPQSSKQETDHLAADVIDRLRISHTLEEAVCGAGLIIEAVKEDRLVKSDIFRDIFSMKTLSDKAIIVTNTSSFQVREFSILSTIFAPRMAGLHFFNPVDKMKLVEIVQTEQVEPSVIETLKQFVQSINKVPVVCKDTPGFIVNHLLVPYLMESIRLVENDVASVEDVDTAMKLGAGYPMGPFELLDLVGLDTVKCIFDGWRALEPNNPNFNPSYLLDSLVGNGNLGKKTKQGFYDYSMEKKEHSSKL